MNQILVTKKLYITPELKRKKKIYKLHFFLSIFVVFVLISMYIYAEYDRSRSEEVSQEILANLDIPDDTVANKNIMVVVLDDEEQTKAQQDQLAKAKEEMKQKNRTTQKTEDGYEYTTVATVKVPKLGIEYPVLDGKTDSVAETDKLLKIAPTKFWGPEPNEVGNFCVVGHNYRDTRFFSKVPTLANGDIVEVTDLAGKTIRYAVYHKYEVVPTDVSCTTQVTNGKKEVTLITCTDDNKLRVVVKAREV